MIQLKTGGAFGVIDGLDGKKAVVLLAHEDATESVMLSAGGKNMIVDLSGKTETLLELALEEDASEISLTTIGSQDGVEGFIDTTGAEYQSLTFSVEQVTETTGVNIPDLILPKEEGGAYSLPRKVYGDGGGALIALHGTRKEIIKGDYIFDGESLGDEEESIYYECEDVPGIPLWTIRASYRLFYLGARVRLMKGPLSKQPTRGARHVDKVMLDVTSLVAGFPYHLSKELPNQLVVKQSGGVIVMREIDSIELKDMLMSGKDEEIAEVANVSFSGGPGEMVYEVQLSTGEHMSSDMVTVSAYEGMLDVARLISYKDGTDYMVHAIVDAEEASIQVTDLNDPTIEHLKVVPVIDGVAVFRMSESIVTQGMRARVSYKKEGKWSPIAETNLIDVSSTYGVKPTNVVVSTKERSAIIGFDIPIDGRYEGTLLYHQGKVTRDVRDTAAITVTALEPETSYTFELAHYDIDGFESERVMVSMMTKKEAVEPSLEPISVFVDNVKMTYKI